MIFMLTALFIGAEWVPNSGEELLGVVLESFSYWLVVGLQAFNWWSGVHYLLNLGYFMNGFPGLACCWLIRAPASLLVSLSMACRPVATALCSGLLKI